MLSTRYYASKAVIEIMPIAPSIMGKDGGGGNGVGCRIDSRLRVYYGTQFAILSSNTIWESGWKTQQEHGYDDFDDQVDPVRIFVTFWVSSPNQRPLLSISR